MEWHSGFFRITVTLWALGVPVVALVTVGDRLTYIPTLMPWELVHPTEDIDVSEAFRPREPYYRPDLGDTEEAYRNRVAEWPKKLADYKARVAQRESELIPNFRTSRYWVSLSVVISLVLVGVAIWTAVVWAVFRTLMWIVRGFLHRPPPRHPD